MEMNKEMFCAVFAAFALFFGGCGADDFAVDTTPDNQTPLHLAWQLSEDDWARAVEYYGDEEQADEWVAGVRVCIRACYEDGGVDFFVFAPPETCNCVTQGAEE